MSQVLQVAVHPVRGCAREVAAAVGEVADVGAVFMSIAEKRDALVELARAAARLEELRLRVLAAADDVAAESGARDAGAWLAAELGLDPAQGRRDLRLARDLERRPAVAAAMRAGELDRVRAEAILGSLDELPGDLDPETLLAVEQHLVVEAARFGPRQLRILGRRVLDVVAPQIAEVHELERLERDEAHAAAVTGLTTCRRGDGTTDLRLRVADTVAERLLTYLNAYTSPRRAPGATGDDRRPWSRRLGHAFGAFLEAFDPTRLPVHGGDATTVIVTLDLDALISGLGAATDGDTSISAGQARRLACGAGLVPPVLDGASQVLDLGRTRRPFSPAQRKALAIRDRTCRAEGCDVLAAWCEAHHTRPWSTGGRTDLADGLLLCSWHHHRAHDHHYATDRLPDGGVRFHRRT